MFDFLWGIVIGASLVIIPVLLIIAGNVKEKKDEALEQRLLNLEQAIEQTVGENNV